jgi:hypothetical protein
MCPVLFVLTFVSSFRLILLEDKLYFEATSRACWPVARRRVKLGDFGGTGGFSSLSILLCLGGLCETSSDGDAFVLAVGFNLSFMAAAAAWRSSSLPGNKIQGSETSAVFEDTDKLEVSASSGAPNDFSWRGNIPGIVAGR